MTKFAYLGPEGTFSQVAAKHASSAVFGEVLFVCCETISEVFNSVLSDQANFGVVPIENSSGGTIMETVDRLVDCYETINIAWRCDLNICLALLGKKNKTLQKIYSHYVPFEHCRKWLDTNYPSPIERIAVQSTSQAAALVQGSPLGAAAIAAKICAEQYDLDILALPEQDVANVTQFLTIMPKKKVTAGHKQLLTGDRTSTMLAFLPNDPGSLCNFLLPFRDLQVNLSRIVSRAIPGVPGQYVFLVDVQGSYSGEGDDPDECKVKGEDIRKAINLATQDKKARVEIVGDYPFIGVFDA